jgi:hypothetical protein
MFTWSKGTDYQVFAYRPQGKRDLGIPQMKWSDFFLCSLGTGLRGREVREEGRKERRRTNIT